jgi:hypothetical protein
MPGIECGGQLNCKIQLCPKKTTVNQYTYRQPSDNSVANAIFQQTNNTTANGGGNAVNSQSGLGNTISSRNTSETDQKGKD